MPEGSAKPARSRLLRLRARAVLRGLSARLLPRTLLWQTFLLIALLLTLALASWSQIFRYFEEAPRARDLAQMVVSVVNLTRTALLNAEAGKRPDLLIELAALEGIRIYPAEPGDEITPLPGDRPMALLTTEIRRQLGEHTRFGASWKSLEGFWVSFRLYPDDIDEYWVMLPSERLKKSLALEWLSWGSAALLVALAGAFLIVSRISVPLRAIASAARIVGRGQTPPRLHETGPQELAEVAHAFNQMAGDLARIDADRALILAGVSHDLRTPLARLRLGIEMSGAPDSEVTAMVADIEEMDRIINQFLEFGRGASQEPAEPLDVVPLLQDLITPHRLRGITIALHAPQSMVVLGRTLPLRRALNNLIDNAIRYAGADKPLDITVSPNAHHARIEVADRGPGIPPSETERMKQPFARLDAARSNVKGSGLGLAIVDRIVRSLDGRFDLLPREGGGLCAVITLPMPKGRAAGKRSGEGPATVIQPPSR